MPPAPKPIGKSFRATLERHGRLGWTIVRIPFDVKTVWGSRGRVRVKGEINGFAFRTALFHTRLVVHWMLITKKMQAGALAHAGAEAKFRIEPDTEERPIVIPQELERALAEDRRLRRWFDQWTGSMRRFIANWVAGPKSAEARRRRAEDVAERLLIAMQGERELPPLLQAAFSRDPRALAGWKRMSLNRRRHELFAIFFYKSPEARARRIAKTMREARQAAEVASAKQSADRSAGADETV
jgi:uncharacterized protein YdeI (YjbR/CyaY-like superfamily)